MKLDAKELGRTVVLGTGVVILTPIVAGFLSGIEPLTFELVPGMLSIGTALAAGASAFVLQLGIEKFLK